MATNTPINARDLGLQATIDRLLGVNTNYVSLSSPTLQFKYGTDNVAQPTQTVVTATLIGSLNGTVTFSTTGIDPAPTTTTNTLTILPDNITGDVATINASLNYLGNTYQAVPITITKIFNQLVAKTTREVDLIASYNDGTGYTLPGTNTITLVNGVIPLTSGVTYGPATQSSAGLTATVNTSTGVITLSQTAPNTWTGTTATFTFTATRNLVSYNTTYTITKAKQGQGGQQLAEIALYQWATAQPAAPTGTSNYTWIGQGHTYNGADTWATTVSANPATAGIKLWKITKSVAAESIATVTSASITWAAGTTTRVITTEANELIKTYSAKVYKNDISLPTIAGTSTFTWSTSNISAAPSGWSLTAPDTQQGFTLYVATVSLLAAQAETSSTIAWTNAVIDPLRYYGADAVSPVIVALSNPYHVLPASNAAGAVVNFYASGTNLIAYEGATPLVYDGIGTTKGSYKVTQTNSNVTTGAITAATSSGVTYAQVADSTAASFTTSQTGTVTYFVSGVRWTGQAFTYTVQQTVTKVIDTAARFISTNNTIITKNLSGVYNPTTITLTSLAWSGSTPSTSGAYFKIFENNDQVAKYSTGTTAENTKVYTPSATASKIRIYLYSNAAFTTLLDQNVVYISKDGETGQTSAIGRTAYAVSTTTPAATPASITVTGDDVPGEGSWQTGLVWLDAAPAAALGSGESLYQSDGVYVIGGDTTWGAPYLSFLKVGNLSALTANTGKLKVTGDILGGAATDYATGTGYVLTSDGKMRLGKATGTRMEWDGSALAIYSDDKTVMSAGEIKWDAIGGTGKAADNATVGADASNLKIGTGNNLCLNSDFTSLGYWSLYNYIIPGTVGINLNTDWTLNKGTGEGTGTIYIFQNDGNSAPAGYSELQSDPIVVVPGNTYFLSAYSGAHRCNVTVFVYYYNLAGGVIGNSSSTTNAGINTGGQLLTGYYKHKEKIIPPANTAYVRVVLRKYATFASQPDLSSYLFATRVMFEETGAGATEPGTWCGSSNSSATRNVHGYVSGRTSWDDAAANSYLTTAGLTKKITDVVTQYGDKFSKTKSWSGSAWVDVDQVIDGNLLVTGTISGDKLAANSILVGHQIKNTSGTFVIDFGSNPYISISV